MINCSCFGHWDIYDKGLEKNVEQALETLLLLDHTFQFFFTPQIELFEKMCLDLLNQLSKKYSDKKICTTLVIGIDSVDDQVDIQKMEESAYLALWKKQNTALCSAFDDVIIPLYRQGSSDSLVEMKRLKKWIIQNTDYLFYYQYAEFAFEQQQIQALIQKREAAGKLKIIKLTEKSTEAAILKLLLTLNKQERFVRIQTLNGKSRAEIAKTLGVTYGRVRQIQFSISIKLRKAFSDNLKAHVNNYSVESASVDDRDLINHNVIVPAIVSNTIIKTKN